MADGINLSALDSEPEIDLAVLDTEPQVEQVQDFKERPSFSDIILAKGMWGISNTISGKTEDNFANVQQIIPGAQLVGVEQPDGQGGFNTVQQIYIPDPETGGLTPLKEEGGIIGDFSVGVGESLRPIAAGLAGLPAAAASVIPGAQAPSLLAMAFTSQLGALAYDNIMKSLGVQDTRTPIEQVVTASGEMALDRFVPEAFGNIPGAMKDVFIKGPKKIAEKTLNFFSKFGLAPENAQVSIANAVKEFRNGVGTKSVRELLGFMEEEGVPATIAHELVATSPEVRAVLENTMKRPFGGTLYKQILNARRGLSKSILNVPQSLKGSTLTTQQMGEALQAKIPQFYESRQHRQSLLRNTLSKRVKGEKVFVGDLINDVQQDKAFFSASDLTDSPAYNKITNYLKLRDSYSQGVSPDMRIDLKVTGKETKKKLSELFGQGRESDIEDFLVNEGSLKQAEDNVKISIDDLFEMEKAARKASRDNYSKVGNEFDQLGKKLEDFSKRISLKIEDHLESVSPKDAKLKKAIDRQWARDTNLFKDGLSFLKRESITPERVIEVALQESRLGGTRLGAIKKAVKRVDKNIWNDFSKTVLDQMGKSGKGDKFFSVRAWNDKYSSLSNEAKKEMFGDIPGLSQRLDKFSEVAKIFQERKLNENPSGTGQFNSYTEFLQNLVTKPVRSGVTGIANYITANLLASPEFIKIATDGIDPKNIRVISKVGEPLRYDYKSKSFVPNQIKRLTNLANTNANLKDDIIKFLDGFESAEIYNQTKKLLERKEDNSQPQAEMLGVRG